MKAVAAILMIFAIEESLAILIVPPVWKRDEGQKKVRMKLTDKQKLEMKMLHLAQSELQSISRSGLIASVSALYQETAADDGLDLLVYFNRLEQQGFLVILIPKTSIFLFLINLKPYCHSFNFDIQKEESEKQEKQNRFSKRKWCIVVTFVYTMKIFPTLHVTPGFPDI